MLLKQKVKVKSLSRVRLFATPWTAAHQAPPSRRFSRQEYWSGLPLSSPVLDTIVVLRFFFLNIHTALSSQLPVYSPKDCRRIPFSPQHLQLCCWRIFEMTILTGVRWYLIGHLICNFVISSDAEYLFMCFMCFQCSCLENPRNGGAWWAGVYGVAESDTTEAT